MTPRKKQGRLVSRYAQLAVYLTDLGDIEAAEESLASARTYMRNLQKWGEWAILPRIHLKFVEGILLQKRGRYAAAEEVFRKGLREADRAITRGTDAPAVFIYSLADVLVLFKADFHGMLAKTFVGQNRLVEAEIEARNGLETYLRRFGRDSPYTARQLRVFGRVLMEQGRFDEAERLAHATVAIYQRMEVPVESLPLAKARLSLAETMALQRRWQAVLAEFATIARALSSEPETFE